MKTAQVDMTNLTTLSFVFFQTDFLPRVRPAFSGGASWLVSVTEGLVEDCWWKEGKWGNGERKIRGRERKKEREEGEEWEKRRE